MNPPTRIVYSPRWGLGVCDDCGADINDNSRFAHLCFVGGKNSYYIAEPVCKNCNRHEDAVLDAERDGRRFTLVCVAIEGMRLGETVGVRCLCGASALFMKGRCPSCIKSSRMVTKQQAAINHLKKAQTQLNKILKDMKNAN